MYGFNAYGNYGYGQTNPGPPPPPTGQAATGQAVPTTNYNNTAFSYPSAASAYANYGASATQHQAASNMAGYGQAVGTPSADYSMFKAVGPPTGSNFAARNSAIGNAGGVSGVNATPIGTAKGSANSNHYAGYEAAVFAAASSYLQAKNTNNTNSWMGQKRGGGGGGRGHNREVQSHFCEVCKITCGGSQTYKEHLEGKAHKKKEAMSKGESTLSLPRNKVSFKCDVCSTTMTGRDTYEAHIKGKNHQKTIALMKRMNLPVPAEEPTLIPPKDLPAGVPIPTVGAPTKKVVGVTGTRFVGGSKLTSTGVEITDDGIEQALLAESNIKPVGEEFIEEQREGGKSVGFSCKLCDCKFSDPNAKNAHLKGRRHRLAYKTKINPSLEVEFKVNPNSAWGQKKRSQRDAGYFNPQQQMYRHPMGGPGPQMRPLFAMPQMPIGQCVESSDDRHVVAKNSSIHPTKQEVEAVEKLVTMVEKTLKRISDKFAEDEKVVKAEVVNGVAAVANEEVNTAEAKKDVESDRLLKGVMRIGLLAKNLLLNSDKEVNLVVLCSKIPTESLLKKVVELFPGHSEKEETEALALTEIISEACIVVNFADIPISCRVTFTCVAVRESAAAADGTTLASVIEKPADALPTKHMLSSLAELRHAKYYQVKCAPLHSMNICLRIVRDISRRVKTWTALSEWSMELLCEKTLSSLQISLSPGDAIRRVFEAIAGGIILKKSSMLLDPCEKEKVDVLAHLSDQEREDITSSAEHALRLISFNQIHKILAIDRLPDRKPMGGPMSSNGENRKRARESSNGISTTDESAEAKKEKKDEPVPSAV